MDPLTQGLLGASATQFSASASRYKYLPVIIGFAAGMAADIDIVIQSQQDPLLFLHYHRQFTHSLIFIPIAALIISVLLYPLIKKEIGFNSIFLFSLLGYGTHGLLDACTSYGTQLLWPFTEDRIAWNLVSVIDPMVTIPMLILVITGLVKGKTIYGKAALLYAVSYIAIGYLQNNRAESYVDDLVIERGHKANAILVKPTLGNNLLWRSVYEYQGRYYVDAVRVGLNKKHYEGTSVQVYEPVRQLTENQKESQHHRDIYRYEKYSDGYLAINPESPDFLFDVRYSMLPNSTKPLWGIKVDWNLPDHHIAYLVNRKNDKQQRSAFIRMLKGE